MKTGQETLTIRFSEMKDAPHSWNSMNWYGIAIRPLPHWSGTQEIIIFCIVRQAHSSWPCMRGTVRLHRIPVAHKPSQ